MKAMRIGDIIEYTRKMVYTTKREVTTIVKKEKRNDNIWIMTCQNGLRFAIEEGKKQTEWHDEIYIHKVRVIEYED